MASIDVDRSQPVLRCEVRPERERVRVLAEGELDFASVETLRRCVDELLDVGFAQVVIDVTGLSFVDSAGFRLLSELTQRALSHGQKVTVHHPSPGLERLAELLRDHGHLAVDAAPR
jgi:anti-anti-sigma factor